MIDKHRRVALSLSSSSSSLAPFINLLIILFYLMNIYADNNVETFSIQANHNQQLSLSGKIMQNAKQQTNSNINNNHTTSTATTARDLLSNQHQQISSSTKHLEQTLNDVSLESDQRPVSYETPLSSSPSSSPSSSSSSSTEEEPLATINNHSQRNQPPARPPQYVDVSNLVARNSNGTSPFSNSGSATASTSSSPVANGLQAKSRSGLPECATQQVCNAIFVRMNYTQKLCECSSNYNWRCSNNLDPQDGHTIELTRKFDKRIYTQIKTCEPLREVRACKSPTDWTLLALQSERSGKAHYVVVCKCPTWAQLEGPYTHNHPPYANIPGIRVYGMLCAHQTARSSAQTYSAFNPSLNILPDFPWPEALNVLNTTNLLSQLDGPH